MVVYKSHTTPDWFDRMVSWAVTIDDVRHKAEGLYFGWYIDGVDHHRIDHFRVDTRDDEYVKLTKDGKLP
jgi:hypothetical protein